MLFTSPVPLILIKIVTNGLLGPIFVVLDYCREGDLGLRAVEDYGVFFQKLGEGVCKFQLLF